MRRRSLLLTITATAAAVGLVAPQLVGSEPIGELRAERERVRAEQAQVASRINTSEASLAEIDAALQTIEENLRTQEAALARTEAEISQAEKDIADAEAEIERLTAEIETLRAEIRRRAIQAYVSPPSEGVLTVFDADDASTASSRQFFIELRAQSDAEIADSLDGANKDIDHERQKATEAKATAEAKKAEQVERTEAVKEAKAQQERVASDLESTINAQIARSVELSTTDRALSKKIAEEQAALVARLAAQKAAEQEAARKAASEREAAEAERIRRESAARHVSASGQESAPAAASSPAPSSGGSSGGGGSSSGGGGGGAAPPTPGPVDSGIQLAYVQGVPVNAAVANQVVAMINAAAADGVSLRIGNSYRSVSHQIQLRMSNCGTSHYAIYSMPSSACRPPTAPPGRSQHQLGLAIDFASCSSRSTACYQWLAGNASRFGYYNLPSEPWHWSTTGN